MKKILLVPALLASSLLLAQDYNYEITPVAGYNIAEGNLNLSNQGIYGGEFQLNNTGMLVSPELSLLYSNPDFKPSLSFFLLLEKVLIQNLISLQDKLNGQPKNEVVIMMYDLMILLTMNQSMKYSRERGFINYEKYLEDKGVGRSVEIMKNRLKIFYSNYLRGPF